MHARPWLAGYMLVFGPSNPSPLTIPMQARVTDDRMVVFPPAATSLVCTSLFKKGIFFSFSPQKRRGIAITIDGGKNVHVFKQPPTETAAFLC